MRESARPYWHPDCVLVPHGAQPFARPVLLFHHQHRSCDVLGLPPARFAHFGGVPGAIVYDRTKTVIRRHVAPGVAVPLHLKAAAFADIYGFAIDVLAAYRPTGKGGVERQVNIVRDHVLAGRVSIRSPSSTAPPRLGCRSDGGRSIAPTGRSLPSALGRTGPRWDCGGAAVSGDPGRGRPDGLPRLRRPAVRGRSRAEKSSPAAATKYCVFARDAVRLLSAHGFAARRVRDRVREWRLASLPFETGCAYATVDRDFRRSLRALGP
jgi:hypothetical protein